MFRRPKKKVATRQPIGVGWEESADGEDRPAGAVKTEVEDEGDVPIFKKAVKKEVKREPDNNEDEDSGTSAAAKPPALLSFDHDEGADADFTVKKNKKKVKEMKRIQKLEEEADEARQEEEERIAEEVKARRPIETERSRRAEDEREKDRREKLEKKKYLDRYRDSSTKGRRPISDDSEPEVLENDDIHEKFPSTFGGIPDSRAVYEAKKRRERMRREGADGYMPLDDDQKLREKGTRERLVREDENDDSDEDAGRFYSSKSLMISEEDRRRDEQNEFLSHEQGDRDTARDAEMDEWEKQQIMKAVSRHTIGRMRTEMDESAKLFKVDQRDRYPYQDENRQPEDMDMDIDMDCIVEEYKRSKGPTNTGGTITIEDVIAKLKLSMGDRQEALNARREEVNKMDKHLEENKAAMQQIEMDAPALANKYAMYQEMRQYSRSLLDCLNEKVAEINDLSDKRRNLAKARTERLIRRRRRDVQDQYGECSAASSGKNINSVRVGDAAVRAAEREARRARRRRERQSTLSGISHEEGLSSDDEETTSQQLVDQQAVAEINTALGMVFVDALDEFSVLRKVLDRMMDWLAVDEKSFQDAYIHLCIPKLASPYIRIQLIQADILGQSDFLMSSMQWYVDALMAGSDNMELNKDNEVVVGLLPLMVEKVVIPFLTDLVTDEWDPMSLKQTTRLGAVLGGLTMYPTLSEKSKPLNTLLDAIRKKLMSCIDEDLFTPMFQKQAIENAATGCRAFLDRQYWSAVKLLRSLTCLSPFISPESHFELAVEYIINKVCVLGIQFGVMNDNSCERKVRALMNELSSDFFTMGDINSFRSMTACLNKVADEQKGAGRDFHRDVRKFIDRLKK